MREKEEQKVEMTENELSKIVIGLAIDVHTTLGPGLLESTYEKCLFYEIQECGLKVEMQKKLPLIYKEITFDTAYRIDLIVEDKLIIEIKAVEELNDVHLAQVLTYIKLSHCKLGLLMNFNTYRLKDGLKRVVNKL